MGASYDATKSEVQAVEEEFLLKLREIKTALNSSGDAAGAAVKKELERLQQENDALKAKNAKLEYRVKHVVAEMEIMYEKLKKLPTVADAASETTSVADATMASF